MVEIAETFRIDGPAYRATFGDRMLPSHLRAMHDIERCRTEPLGGQVYHCETCQAYHYSYHSCNRHGPKCQQEQAEEWLEHQKRLLLPVPHFMVTFTLPAELRALARRHQKTLYHILFRSSSEALQELASIAGSSAARSAWWECSIPGPAICATIPTCITAGGGLSAEDTWLPSRQLPGPCHAPIHALPSEVPRCT